MKLFPENKDEIVAEVKSKGSCPLYGSVLRDLFPTGVVGNAALLQFCKDNKLTLSMRITPDGVASDVFVFTKDLLI